MRERTSSDGLESARVGLGKGVRGVGASFSAHRRKPYTRAAAKGIYSGDVCNGEAGSSSATRRKVKLIEIIDSGDESSGSGHDSGHESSHYGRDSRHSSNESGHSSDDDSDHSSKYTYPCSECPGHSGNDFRYHKAERFLFLGCSYAL
jgi:hypothetical protein